MTFPTLHSRRSVSALLSLTIMLVASEASAQSRLDPCAGLARASCIDTNSNGHCGDPEDAPLPKPTLSTFDNGMSVVGYQVGQTAGDNRNLIINTSITFSADYLGFFAAGNVTLCRAPRRLTAVRPGLQSAIYVQSNGGNAYIGANVRLQRDLGLVAIGNQVVVGDGLRVLGSLSGGLVLTSNEATTIGKQLNVNGIGAVISSKHRVVVGDFASIVGRTASLAPEIETGTIRIEAVDYIALNRAHLRGNKVELTLAPSGPALLLSLTKSFVGGTGKNASLTISTPSTLDVTGTYIDRSSFSSVSGF